MLAPQRLRPQRPHPTDAGHAATRARHGLWLERIWAEWLGALSGALYLPLEAGHLMHKPTLINGAVLLVVGFLAFQLWRRMKSPHAFHSV